VVEPEFEKLARAPDESIAPTDIRGLKAAFGVPSLVSFISKLAG
jgi:hypothetical protein